jgi:asparagine synthase (glutamine-hydrolysing)
MRYHSGMSLVERQLLDATRFSLPTLLRYEDRNSMGNSVESRLPFVDYRVAELGLALPNAVKVRNGFGKWIVREAMYGRIPEHIRSARYKRGFDVNEPAWIEAGLGAAIREALHSKYGRIQDLLPHGAQIDTLYSDERLKSHSNTFAETISLLWLSDRL